MDGLNEIWLSHYALQGMPFAARKVKVIIKNDKAEEEKSNKRGHYSLLYERFLYLCTLFYII